MIRSGLRRILDRFRPSKERTELRWWRERANSEEGLSGEHYERVFTTHFELRPSDFSRKRVLDVGCGPRGSLEWAAMATERVGLDPLANQYRELGIDRHSMSYVSAPAEAMPFDSDSFDVIASLNSLDHVDDVDRTISEITRVAAPGATLLLMVEVGHEATDLEPHSFDWNLPDRFRGWRREWSARNGVRPDHNLYGSIDDGVPYGSGPGLLRARLIRSPSDAPNST
jgi:SAM-dependent methyltransferase